MSTDWNCRLYKSKGSVEIDQQTQKQAGLAALHYYFTSIVGR